MYRLNNNGFEVKLVILVVLSILTACENNLKDVYNEAQLNGIDTVLQPNIIFSRGGILKAQIFGDTLLVHHNYQTFINDVKIFGYDSTEEKNYEIIGDSATIFPDVNEAYIEKNVRIVNYDKKDTIWCENLTLKYNKDSVFTNKPVHIKTQTQNIFGQAMYSDVNLSNYKIIQPKGTIAKKYESE